MRNFIRGTVRDVSLREIDLEGEAFRVSRRHTDDRLRKSILNFGLLELPVLLGGVMPFEIVFGHNRIAVVATSGAGSCRALVVDEIGPVEYADYALLKNYRNELGPVGKLRVIHILRERLNADAVMISNVAYAGLNIPDFFIEGGVSTRVLSGLPAVLTDYLDIRDINFRVIRNMLSLPDDGIALLGNWVGAHLLRVNVFRDIVDMLYDIYARDRSLAALRGCGGFSLEDRRADEERLYGEIFAVRNPDYVRIRESADRRVREFSEKKIEVAFPPYFEGDTVKVSLTFEKGEDEESVNTKLARLHGGDIMKLLEYL